MKRAAALLLVLATAPVAAATPDGAVADCRRPASAAERTVCANPALQAADQALAALVAAWRPRVPEAEAEQRDWLYRRDRMCGPAMHPDCLRIAYAERMAWLREALAALPPAMAAAPPLEAAPPAGAPLPPAAMPAVVPPPPGMAMPPLAARLATASCGMVGSTALRAQGWTDADTPFGQSLGQWSRQDFAALIRRFGECGTENREGGRASQQMASLLNQLHARAREATPPAAPLPEAAPAVDCADPALLQDVAFTAQATPGLSQGARIRQMLRPRPYADVITQAYDATPALRAEYQRLQPYMMPVPQCLVEAETAETTLTLSYRLYREGGRTLVEVQRVP